jgi:hypothetical protein
MGKKKYETISELQSANSRNITYFKRIKGLIKKSIELSVLCNQEVIVYVVDHAKKKMLHYNSHPHNDILDLFNDEFEREFVTNVDYMKVGGDKQEWTVGDSEEGGEQFKKFLKSHW